MSSKTKIPVIYSRYNRPVIPGFICSDPTRTQQHFADECDINQIVNRALRTGSATLFTTDQRAAYYDASSYEDYQTALDMISDVRDDFSSLPSSVRDQFGENPDKYVAFMSDSANYKKAIEMGLLAGPDKPATPPPGVEPVKQDPPPAGPSET